MSWNGGIHQLYKLGCLAAAAVMLIVEGLWREERPLET